jgi:uncharacterized integral membrane protein (TIGR00698 family)
MSNRAKAAATVMSLPERWLLGRPLADTPKLVPGLLLAAAVVTASVLLADYVNSSVGFKGFLSYIMTAIVIGLIVGNAIAIPPAFAAGVSFCVVKMLRLGIILLGLRLSIFDAIHIGVWGLPIVLICITTGLVLTTYFTRLLGLPDRLGTLLAVGTGICGASAIVATAPAIEAEDQEVAYAVANITLFGILATLVYPYLAHWLFAGNVVMVGLFEGTAIHDTSQVTGAALIYDQAFGVTAKPSAADVAIVTKLVRNVFIAIVVPLMAYLYARRVASRGGAGGAKVKPWKLLPVFVLGFLVMAILRSLGDAGTQHNGLAFGIWSKAEWARSIGMVSDAAGYALAAAMAGVGLGTHFKTLKGLGVKPFAVGLFAALVVGVASAVAVTLLGGHVQF